MLIAARAHDFEVNQDVICKLFRVSPDLLRRRIGECSFVLITFIEYISTVANAPASDFLYARIIDCFFFST